MTSTPLERDRGRGRRPGSPSDRCSFNVRPPVLLIPLTLPPACAAPPRRLRPAPCGRNPPPSRSEEHTSELQSREISYAVFCLKKKKKTYHLVKNHLLS